MKFEKLADTLEIIAKEGAEAFYHGRIAEDLIRDIQEAGISAWIASLTAAASALVAIRHERLFLVRRNVDGGGLDGVQGREDGCVERSPGGVPNVLPPAACRGSHRGLCVKHHKRLRIRF